MREAPQGLVRSLIATKAGYWQSLQTPSMTTFTPVTRYPSICLETRSDVSTL
jgi:hypothetical protein